MAGFKRTELDAVVEDFTLRLFPKNSSATWHIEQTFIDGGSYWELWDNGKLITSFSFIDDLLSDIEQGYGKI